MERGEAPGHAVGPVPPHLELRVKRDRKEDPRTRAWISAALLRWFRTAARPMAWRETRDPYRIWVSEIMLQQTRVETVAPYYERFLLEFSDVGSLARAPLDAVLKAWEGLGYYSRARNLHRAAGIVVARHGAKVPRTVEALEALPGIGRSTAGAIAAIAFGADVPILDANARRVVARLFCVEGDLRSSAAEKALWERSASLVRKGKGRDTALAVMDLGAVVCLPNFPRCGQCPVSSRCLACLRGLQDSIPPKRAKKVLPHRDVVAAVFRRTDGALFLMRRPPDGLLGGLWAFPSGKRNPGETLADALRRTLREKLQVRAVIQKKVGAVRHAYSHYRITLHGFTCETPGGALPVGEGTGWLPVHEEGRYALPRADRTLVEIIHRGGKR
jgi:A/G-specific adenine glycosylase